MATKKRTTQTNKPGKNWMTSALENYSIESAGDKKNSSLLLLGEKIKLGTVTSEEFLTTKKGILEFINIELSEARPATQNALFLFLIQSELINESQEIRKSLFDVLKKRTEKPLDGLSTNIITSLLRSNKLPSTAVLSAFFEKTKNEFSSNPRWSLIGILAAAMGRVQQHTYEMEDFLNDLALLDKGDEEFIRAVRWRNPIWAALTPPTDAITIVSRVRSKNSVHAPNYPPSFTLELDRVMRNSKQTVAYIT